MSASQPRTLVVDYGTLLFIGRIGAVPAHRCAATVIAFGLDREFELTTPAGVSRGRAMVAAPGTVRSVDAFDGRLAVCLIDPGLGIDERCDRQAALDVLSRITPSNIVHEWPRFLEALRLSRPFPMDTRVAAAADLLRGAAEEVVPADRIAASVGLSVSRLEHLFTQHIGAPMRSFRTWWRFRTAAQALAAGKGLTEAALDAGFFDQAHFTRSFRQWFGLAPSQIFSADMSIRVLPGL